MVLFNDRVVGALKLRPWMTNRQLADLLGVDIARISAVTSRLSLARTPRLRRIERPVEHGRTVFQFALVDQPDPVPTHEAAPCIPPSFIDDLVEQLREKVAAMLAEELAKALATTVRTPDAALTYAVARKPRLRVVLVIGLLPQQAGLVSAEFEARLDLRFWKDENPAKLRAMAAGADAVLFMTSKISHKTVDQLKTVCSPEPVRGGLTSLRHRLAALVDQPTLGEGATL